VNECATPAGSANHPWRFFRAGGCDQVKIETAADLRALGSLDPKLWVALSCPVRGLEFDTRTLELIDTDGDGRIRVPEIRAAVQWVCKVLKRPADLREGAAALPLSSIEDGGDEGRALLASARRVLASLGKPQAAEITVADTTDTARILAQTRFNGDGVIPPEATPDPALKAAIAEIMACISGQTGRCGKAGVTQESVDAFFAELKAFSDWWKKAEDNAAAVLPLADGTAAAHAALTAVRAKIDDYFVRCRLASFDPRAGGVLNRSEAELAALAAKDLSAGGAEVASFPLAHVEAGRPLPLGLATNPAWDPAMNAFRNAVLNPLLGKDKESLSADEWAGLLARFAPYEAWLSAKTGARVEKLGIQRARELLAGNVKASLDQLIAQDKAGEYEMSRITALDRLVRYHRDLFRLLDNFVSFREFYGRGKAIFQAGTLYMDGRSFDLCVRVADTAKHATLATLGRSYLAYCDCTRPKSAEKMTIAVAFTGGDAENIMVGRNGVFFDRAGRDWDATVVKLIEHPISIRQAILSPYKRIGRMISAQIEKMAAAREKAVEDKAALQVAATAQAAAQPGKPAAPPGAPPAGISNTVGVLAAIGLAIGAIGTALATAFSAFFGLKWWQMPLAILGILIIISGPSVVIAWLKLRQRNLGPILDACGWAVNGRVKLSIRFGGTLTKLAELPPGAVRLLDDPYADRAGRVRRWFWIVFLPVAAALIVYFALVLKGVIDLPGFATSKPRVTAPPAPPPAAAEAVPQAQ